MENLGDGNDTGVISAARRARRHDQRRHGRRHPRRRPGERHLPRRRRDRQRGLRRHLRRQHHPHVRGHRGAADGRLPSTGNGQAGENDSIAADVEGLTGGNGNDTLTGNGGANTIAGSAPPGTPNVDPQPAGTESRDTINGGGGDDTLVAGDSGTVNGGDGNDTVVGGRSFANVTAVNGGNGDDTLVSGLGSDNLTGGAGSDTLAYVSVSQGGLQHRQSRHRPGVLVRLPEPGTTGSGGTIGGQEKDVIHDDIRTLIGSNGNDT